MGVPTNTTAKLTGLVAAQSMVDEGASPSDLEYPATEMEDLLRRLGIPAMRAGHEFIFRVRDICTLLLLTRQEIDGALKGVGP